MDRLSEIRARFEEAKADNARGYMIPTADVEYLLAEIERLKQANRIAAAAWDNSALNFSEAQMERWKARAEKAEAENRWIPVSERLPENGIDALLYWSNDAQNEKYVDIERYHIDHWETLDRPWIRAIAWMPLPEPPKGE